MNYSRAQLSWIWYDIANAAFALIVRTVFAPMFFKSYASTELEPAMATSYWGLVSSAAGIAAGILAPWLGTIADARGGRKRFLGVFLGIGVTGTLALTLAGPGDAVLVLGCYFVSLMAYMASNSFYDALLIDVSPRGSLNRLSTMAYAWGYIGAVVPFLVCLAVMFIWKGEPVFGMKFSFVVAALWWLGLSIPLFRNVREKRKEGVPPQAVGMLEGFRRLARTARDIGQYREAALFLLAYFLYIDGVGTIFMMATPLSEDIGISPLWLLGTILALQFIGFPFTILYAMLSKRISARRLVYAAIGVYLVIALLTGLIPVFPNPDHKLYLFLIIAFLIGTSQGGIQSLSRSLFSRLIPHGRAAEFFGFYNIFGKFTTIVGPILIYFVAVAGGRTEYGIALLAVPFLLGGILLSRVKFPGGAEQ